MARHLRNDRQAYFALASTPATPHRPPSPPPGRKAIPLSRVLLWMGVLVAASMAYPYVMGVL